MTRNAVIESYEFVMMQFIRTALEKGYSDFKNSFSQLTFDEIECYLLSQGAGRGAGSNVNINQYLNLNRNLARRNQAEQDLEESLKEKIASLSLFNVGLERFVYDSVISELVTYGIDYETFISPNSSDHAFLLRDETILKLLNNNYSVHLNSNQIPLLKEFLTSKKSDDFQGVLIHIDAKSIMAMKNAGDAIKDNRPIQFEAKWNQISYDPLRLRNARLGAGATQRLTLKYQTLPTIFQHQQEHYLVLSYFVPCLIYIDPASQYFNDPFNQISGSHFECVTSLCSLPNGELQSPIYDGYFYAGKSGNDGDYPKDCRFRWGQGNQNLQFLNLPTLNVERGHYFDPPGNYNYEAIDNQGARNNHNFIIP